MAYHNPHAPPLPVVLGPTQRPRPSFAVPATSARASTSYLGPSGGSTQNSGSVNTSTPGPFKAPAHRHAHHLHSIPPREKSARTLIIDYQLWTHARTRFAQARSELGMTDRSGGPSSPNYAHRERPENWDESEEVPSDGEDVGQLFAREGGPGHPHDEDEDSRFVKQDLDLAKRLRLRSEALEKVVSGMLEQPPMDHAFPEDEPVVPATASPKQRAANLNGTAPTGIGTGKHPHILPNGVRLRLALATVLNDLFARQAPQLRHLRPEYSRSGSSTTEGSQPSPILSTDRLYSQSPFSSSGLPYALYPLSVVSSASASHASAFPNTPYSYSPQPTQQIQYTMYPPPQPSPRTRDMFIAGADPTTANSPPSLRCPRHLTNGCEICVEAKTKINTRFRGGSTHNSSQGRNTSGVVGRATGVTGFKDGSGVGSGLARPGPGGNVMRRQVGSEQDVEGDRGMGTTGKGNTRLSELIPRFIRLSALVSLELGREAGLGPDDDDAEPARPLSSQSSSNASSRIPPTRSYTRALKPTSEWYMLLVGLLTRAVLEGYLTGHWRGLSPVQVLLGVGLGLAPDGVSPSSLMPPDPFAEFDPDDLPDLGEAIRILFPALRAQSEMVASGAPGGAVCPRREDGEAMYEREMMARLAKFFDVPSSTPDLSTHMEDLAWMFPAEPVERATLRFCEAIARWRGKPEIENYKKHPPSSWRTPASTPADTTAAATAATPSSHPPTPATPATPHTPHTPQTPMSPQMSRRRANSGATVGSIRAPIEKYFMVPSQTSGVGRKRGRSFISTSPQVPGRVLSEHGQPGGGPSGGAGLRGNGYMGVSSGGGGGGGAEEWRAEKRVHLAPDVS